MDKKLEILLRRKNKILLDKGNGKLPIPHIVTFCANLEALGYKPSKEFVKVLKTHNESDIEPIYTQVVQNLRELKGAHKKFEPMYPNFPKQVMEMEEAELYVNAMLHYLGDLLGLRILPEYDEKRRSKLKQDIKYTTLDIGTEGDIKEIFVNLVKSNSSISDTDKTDVVFLLSQYKSELESLLPETIPQKETVGFVCGEIMKTVDKPIELVSKYIKTATDLLRLCVYRSGGDVSLATNTKFISFPRRERKIYLGLLERIGSQAVDDMLKYKEVWKRLGERLHPGEFAKKGQYKSSNKSFSILRNNEKHLTLMGKVGVDITSKKFLQASVLLKSRPGEFARRLDYLLRESTVSQGEEILKNFLEVISKVSTPVLLQVKNHFENRNSYDFDWRVFFPKGQVSKFKSIENKLNKISDNLVNAISFSCRKELVSRFSKLEDLGKVYIDDSIKGFTVPQGLRSASKSLKTIPRLSRVPLGDEPIVRFFIWWKDITGSRVDLDLSAYQSDEEFSNIEGISYMNLRDSSGIHSGDITSAPNGACEFIDINISKFLKSGKRYVVMNVNSYTGQKFIDMPEAFAGFMMRSGVGQNGEIFDARTVENKFDLTGDKKIAVPMILDLKNRELIWLDLSLGSKMSMGYNIRNTGNSLNVLLRSMVETRKSQLIDLIKLHVEARGVLVENKTDADLVFSKNEGITPYDLEKIMADYMV